MSDRKGARGRPPAAAPRRCLRCGRTFLSEGIHQRICRTCKRTRRPDDAEAGERWDSEVSRLRREQGLRRLMGLPTRQVGIARFIAGLGHRFAICQWIEGEPTADDACKCGRRVRGARFIANSTKNAPCAGLACRRRHRASDRVAELSGPPLSFR